MEYAALHRHQPGSDQFRRELIRRSIDNNLACLRTASPSIRGTESQRRTAILEQMELVSSLKALYEIATRAGLADDAQRITTAIAEYRTRQTNN
jgi:hypothetical protein